MFFFFLSSGQVYSQLEKLDPVFQYESGWTEPWKAPLHHLLLGGNLFQI